MDLENVQETMTLCLQIKVVFLKIFLQTKSGNAAFISSIVYATCSWCMKTLASLVWKQEDLSNNDDTLKFARESNSYKHSIIYIYIFLPYYTSLECGCLWYPLCTHLHALPCPAMHTGPLWITTAQANPVDAGRHQGTSHQSRNQIWPKACTTWSRGEVLPWHGYQSQPWNNRWPILVIRSIYVYM